MQTKSGPFSEIAAQLVWSFVAPSPRDVTLLLNLGMESTNMGSDVRIRAEYVAMSALLAVSVLGLVMILGR